MYFMVIAKHYQRCTITFTATETGTYTVEITWMKTDSNGNYINDDSKGYNKVKLLLVLVELHIKPHLILIIGH